MGLATQAPNVCLFYSLSTARFSTKAGKCPPAKVRRMRVETVPGKNPVRFKARKHPAAQRAFLNKYAYKLFQMDFFQPNPDTKWQAAPLLVPKKKPKAKFRLAVDLRPVNAATVKQAWPMPYIDSELHAFAGCSAYAVLDFVSGFWQLPLHPDSYEKMRCGDA